LTGYQFLKEQRMDGRSFARGLLLASCILVGNCLGGPTVSLGSNVPEARRIPAGKIDHSTWDSLLKKYVDAHGMVNYQAWKDNASDKQQLEQYLAHLSSASFTGQTRSSTKLAFWINAYNAVTVEGILREYPTSSIRNHTAKLFGYNIWKDLQLWVEGKPYSLDQMEHEVLRKMKEPRIHFAIVCASIGCPRLLNEAYVPARIDEQLTVNAQAFFADPTKFRFDVNRNSVSLSPILEWFGEDFGNSSAEQLQRIAPYVPAAARNIVTRGTATIDYLDYDWNLNDIAQDR
jgi:hypothetical protein